MARVGIKSAVGKVLELLGERDKRAAGGNTSARSIAVPDGVEWLVWRPIVEGVATLEEVDTYYDLLDLLRLHDALDFKARLSQGDE